MHGGAYFLNFTVVLKQFIARQIENNKGEFSERTILKNLRGKPGMTTPFQV